MKNVYARFAYATRSEGQVYDPYAQLMPLTNVEDAHNDWVTWYNKWGGNSSSPSSVSLGGQPTLQPSSVSYPSSYYLTPSPPPSTPYPSSYSSPLPSAPYPSSYSLTPSPSPSPSPSSASDPVATGGNNIVTGAVEDDTPDETVLSPSSLRPSPR